MPHPHKAKPAKKKSDMDAVCSISNDDAALWIAQFVNALPTFTGCPWRELERPRKQMPSTGCLKERLRKEIVEWAKKNEPSAHECRFLIKKFGGIA